MKKFMAMLWLGSLTCICLFSYLMTVPVLAGETTNTYSTGVNNFSTISPLSIIVESILTIVLGFIGFSAARLYLNMREDHLRHVEDNKVTFKEDREFMIKLNEKIDAQTEKMNKYDERIIKVETLQNVCKACPNDCDKG